MTEQREETALVGKEHSRYNIDIAALSETRLADKGQLTNAEVVDDGNRLKISPPFTFFFMKLAYYFKGILPSFGDTRQQLKTNF